MLDLSFGLPIVVRDAALKMVAPGPQSDVNREYYAQNHEREIEEGRGGAEAYEKTDEKARELLRKLAQSKPYFRKGRTIEDGEGSSENAMSTALTTNGPGPIRAHSSRGADRSRGTRGRVGGGRGGARSFPSTAQLPPSEADILPPSDPTITSLFVTGVEDDLPEHKIRDFFSAYGKIRSLVCSHMSHCAFINFQDREGAEAAANALQGRAVIAGCPLRVQWGRPRPVGTMDKDERSAALREGRQAFRGTGRGRGGGRGGVGGGGEGRMTDEERRQKELDAMTSVAAPPGQGDVNYASLGGD